MEIVIQICFIIGLSVRFWLFKTNFPAWLSSRVEISTPLTSWKRMMEGVFLTRENVSPYSGDLFHETPLMLKFSNVMLEIFGQSDYLVFLAIDALTGVLLMKIAKLFARYLLQKQTNDVDTYSKDAAPILLKAENLKKLQVFIVAVHFLNPYSIGVCLARSTGIIHNFLILLAFYWTAKANMILSTLCLAMATYECFYPVVLCVPAALYFYQCDCYQKKNTDSNTTSSLPYFIKTFILFVFWLSLLFSISYMLQDSLQFFNSIYGFIFTVPDLTPNIGVFWYFFTEMFEHFRVFFLFVFQINAIVYTVPLAIRFKEQPLFLMYILTFLTGVFKSYPSYSDVALFLCLLPLWKHLFPYLRNSFIVTCMFITSTVFSPLLWHLWLYAGSANANFYFAITLVFTTAEIFLVTDLLYANLRWEFDLNHGLNYKLENGKECQAVLE
ncbi:phosphatidylinositol glycan anchor biosynthesis class U protein [Octopus sinensis]|uniref:Phosphatidylinositol glycan anchor biosynthesis class U protein n=1 Tax=Octopus sinensis TaxID=2607531 RepID=A0A6P7TL92_9MOLL|nr:phosphatidylinositol glycan anchor biosynthesis class U protein [Octopus sinensis]